jgi:hypothetical protein
MMIAYIRKARKGLHKGRYIWIARTDKGIDTSVGSRATRYQIIRDLKDSYPDARVVSKSEFTAQQTANESPAGGGGGVANVGYSTSQTH